MSVYLDASVVVSIFVADSHSIRVRAWLRLGGITVLSRWTVTEFSSALSHYVRTGRLAPDERDRAEAAFDLWLRQGPPVLDVTPDDFDEARRLLQKIETLRAPDALHLAFVRQRGWQMATLDKGLAKSASILAVQLAPL